MDTDKLAADLTDQEGCKAFLYDDATGKSVAKGVALQGNPTIGVGWNVAGRQCTSQLAQIIVRYFIDETWNELVAALPWVLNIPEPCQRALCNLSFNMGLPTLQTFVGFLSLMQTGNYSLAADDLGTTRWFRQVGTRGPKIQALIKEGIL